MGQRCSGCGRGGGSLSALCGHSWTGARLEAGQGCVAPRVCVTPAVTGCQGAGLSHPGAPEQRVPAGWDVGQLDQSPHPSSDAWWAGWGESAAFRGLEARGRAWPADLRLSAFLSLDAATCRGWIGTCSRGWGRRSQPWAPPSLHLCHFGLPEDHPPLRAPWSPAPGAPPRGAVCRLHLAASSLFPSLSGPERDSK